MVINYFSTIALEACFFDKPVLSLAYRPERNYGWLHPPKYANHPDLIHNKRLRTYGAVHMVWSRDQLKAAIIESLKNPDETAPARRKAVQLELGCLDGKVVERLADACAKNYLLHRQTPH